MHSRPFPIVAKIFQCKLFDCSRSTILQLEKQLFSSTRRDDLSCRYLDNRWLRDMPPPLLTIHGSLDLSQSVLQGVLDGCSDMWINQSVSHKPSWPPLEAQGACAGQVPICPTICHAWNYKTMFVPTTVCTYQLRLDTSDFLSRTAATSVKSLQ